MVPQRKSFPRRHGHLVLIFLEIVLAPQELVGLKRGKNQTAKELADSARRLASHAYYLKDYAIQEKPVLHAFQTGVGK